MLERGIPQWIKGGSEPQQILQDRTEVPGRDHLPTQGSRIEHSFEEEADHTIAIDG